MSRAWCRPPARRTSTPRPASGSRPRPRGGSRRPGGTRARTRASRARARLRSSVAATNVSAANASSSPPAARATDGAASASRSVPPTPARPPERGNHARTPEESADARGHREGEEEDEDAEPDVEGGRRRRRPAARESEEGPSVSRVHRDPVPKPLARRTPRPGRGCATAGTPRAGKRPQIAFPPDASALRTFRARASAPTDGALRRASLKSRGGASGSASSDTVSYGAPKHHALM